MNAQVSERTNALRLAPTTTGQWLTSLTWQHLAAPGRTWPLVSGQPGEPCGGDDNNNNTVASKVKEARSSAAADSLQSVGRVHEAFLSTLLTI